MLKKIKLLITGILTILILSSNNYIFADKKMDTVLDNTNNIDYTEYRTNCEEAINNAKQYEMNIIMTLITQDKPDRYDWNAMKYAEEGLLKNVEPLGVFDESKIQEVAGVTKSEAEEKLKKYHAKAHELGSYSNEEVQALKPSCAELALISNIEIHYYCSDNTLIQYIVSTRSDKVLYYYVLWKDNRVVDYVRRDF